MNRIIIYTVLGFFCLVNSITANNTKSIFSINDRYSDTEIAQQISDLSSDIELKYTKEVKTLINIYISSGRPSSEAILSRSNYYFPLMESIIQKHNLPEEIKYLSVIESGLRPTVRSKAGAVGLWQFISSTAKMYDLKIGSVQDDRQDLMKSTEAAMLYLNDLYERFDDWGLAIAAYNCGPGNINKAIRRSGGKKTYWEVQKYLPRETRRYIPKLVATIYVMSYFEQYGLVNMVTNYTEHTSFGVANVYDKISFSKISELSGLSVREIKKYNTAYKHNYMPASRRGNKLILPEAYLHTFLQNRSETHNLTQVFYLKNTLFTAPAAIVEEKPVVEVENTRIDVITQAISGQDFQLFETAVSLPVIGEVTPIQLAEESRFAIMKLRKRQSFKEALDSNPQFAEDIKHSDAIVNVAGVVMIKK
ncbi:lytic transglycosylase domain-containing protein [Saprospiraceae bacterium]|nr:lytic transglycosylase domain-containing protein [Saprospiraceae bacterium]